MRRRAHRYAMTVFSIRHPENNRCSLLKDSTVRTREHCNIVPSEGTKHVTRFGSRSITKLRVFLHFVQSLPRSM